MITPAATARTTARCIRSQRTPARPVGRRINRQKLRDEAAMAAPDRERKDLEDALRQHNAEEAHRRLTRRLDSGPRALDVRLRTVDVAGSRRDE
jgi:hypothetical protein